MLDDSVEHEDALKRVKPLTPYVSVAPMMDWTDRHCRYFHRLLSPSAHLYTEMVTTNAILYGNRDRHLRYDVAEQPVALQLGGSFPEALGKCAQLGENYGYDEINLNCGCPSDRVQQGKFGACLMNEPYLVAACVDGIAAKTDLTVSVKCRIGIDDSDEYEFTKRFITEVSRAGCRKFILHARKAWLQGLSPKENREKPPLRYDVVERLKNDFPDFFIVLNGGITSLDAALGHLQNFEGIMIGREAYQNPYILAELHAKLTGSDVLPTREDVARRMGLYIDAQKRVNGTPAKSIIRHMLGLFNGQKGARAWRRYLSENMHRFGTDGAVIDQALEAMKPEAESDQISIAARCISTLFICVTMYRLFIVA